LYYHPQAVNTAWDIAIDSALKQANDNKLVTFGIVPTDANTGYGYIKSLKNGQVEAFVEKPDLQTAQSYLKQGNYLWNSIA
jgi:mannose-1-phosphate guanylyltransferase